jgi:hypothetical protein
MTNVLPHSEIRVLALYRLGYDPSQPALFISPREKSGLSRSAQIRCLGAGRAIPKREG